MFQSSQIPADIPITGPFKAATLTPESVSAWVHWGSDPELTYRIFLCEYNYNLLVENKEAQDISRLTA